MYKEILLEEIVDQTSQFLQILFLFHKHLDLLFTRINFYAKIHIFLFLKNILHINILQKKSNTIEDEILL